MFDPLVKQLVNSFVNLLPHVLFFPIRCASLAISALINCCLTHTEIFIVFFFLNATVIKEICVRLHCEVNVILGRKLKFQNITAATKCTVLHVPVIYNCLFFFFLNVQH